MIRLTIAINQYHDDHFLKIGILSESCLSIYLVLDVFEPNASMFAISLNAPGTPAGSCLNNDNAQYT